MRTNQGEKNVDVVAVSHKAEIIIVVCELQRVYSKQITGELFFHEFCVFFISLARM